MPLVPPNPPIVPARVPSIRVTIPLPNVVVTAAHRAQFLRRKYAARGFNDMKHWVGTRVIGSGGSGTVTHWLWNPALNRTSVVGQLRTPRGRAGVIDVAVKVVAAPTDVDLAHEATIMNALYAPNDAPNILNRNHVLRIFASNAFTARDCQREGIVAGTAAAPVWLGRTRRIIMEYCLNGNLEQLRARRIDRFVEQSKCALRCFTC